MVHDTYMQLGHKFDDTFVDVPDTDEWLQAYLHRGWELVDVQGKRMLKYPSEMGTPLVPVDTVPFWSNESPVPKGRKRSFRKGR